MNPMARLYMLDLARLSLVETLSEFPEFRERWACQRLLRYALQRRLEFRDAALEMRGAP